MESKNSVRNRLRAAAPEADDRALLYEQLEAQRQPLVDPAVTLSTGIPASRTRALDGVFDILVKAGYRIDDAINQVKAKPLTALAIATGAGLILTKLLSLRTSRRR